MHVKPYSLGGGKRNRTAKERVELKSSVTGGKTCFIGFRKDENHWHKGRQSSLILWCQRMSDMI